ncbi:MAG TPA: pyridoxamine 5'-phosphate oxidase family protein [Candidatus Saccharimonadales bacterium]|nr:pyridoxamine 5'-phosphate oxidase family protein [Candidatus Saccharimonadales bacterium]
MSVDATESRERITDFLKLKGVGVLATVDGSGQPYAATVYVTTDEPLNLYFVTKRDTQKCRNLQANPRAAIAIYDATTQTTVQAEGTVVEVTDARQQEWVFKDIWSRAAQTSPGGVPPITQLIAGGYVVFRLSAPSLRMATFKQVNNGEPADIFEVVHTQPSQ